MNKIPKCHICGTDKITYTDNWVENGIEMEEVSHHCPHSEIHDQRPQLVFEHLPENVCMVVGLELKHGGVKSE